ncbi:hypothetical protein LCGC14_1393140, partial [marine sediment metagenome]
MNDRKFNEKLLEFFMELAKPKKYEVGYADGIRIVQDGLSILGLDASDILGFTKPANERSIRRLRGTQAWFKKMYEDGWRYTGTFEYEGLPYNGFVVMERELPNKTLDAIRDEIEVILATSANVDIKPTFWYSTAVTFIQFFPADDTEG